MQRLSIHKTRGGGFRVGHDKRFVTLSASSRDVKLRASSKQEAHRKGKVAWRSEYGRIEAHDQQSSPKT